MKTLKFILFAAFLLLCTVSCTKDENFKYKYIENTDIFTQETALEYIKQNILNNTNMDSLVFECCENYVQPNSELVFPSGETIKTPNYECWIFSYEKVLKSTSEDIDIVIIKNDKNVEITKWQSKPSNLIIRTHLSPQWMGAVAFLMTN